MLLDGKLDLDDKGGNPPGTPSRAWAITLGVCLVPIYIAFSAFGMQGKGTAAAIALGTLILAVKLHSKFKKEVWFWVVIGLMATVNALIITYVPFPNKDYIFPIAAPLGFADYFLISFSIRSIEKAMRKKQPPSSASQTGIT